GLPAAAAGSGTLLRVTNRRRAARCYCSCVEGHGHRPSVLAPHHEPAPVAIGYAVLLMLATGCSPEWPAGSASAPETAPGLVRLHKREKAVKRLAAAWPATRTLAHWLSNGSRRWAEQLCCCLCLRMFAPGGPSTVRGLSVPEEASSTRPQVAWSIVRRGALLAARRYRFVPSILHARSRWHMARRCGPTPGGTG